MKTKVMKLNENVMEEVRQKMEISIEIEEHDKSSLYVENYEMSNNVENVVCPKIFTIGCPTENNNSNNSENNLPSNYSNETLAKAVQDQHSIVIPSSSGNGKATMQSTDKPPGSKNPKKWIVLIAAFTTLGVATGFPFNMSVLYVEWLQEFGKSNSETALVQSVCTGLFLIGGCISGIIVTKYGAFKCGIVGGILAAAGLSISFVATSIFFLVIFVGIVSGIGFSLSFISASTSVGQHFEGKQRLLALAFISSGAGVGSSVLPNLLEKLIQEYNWRGTLLVIGGMMLHLIVNACLFYKPLSKIKHITSDASSESSSKSTNSICKNCNSPGEKGIAKNSNWSINDTKSLKRVSFSTSEIRRVYEAIEKDDNKNMYQLLKQLLKNRLFMCYIFAQALCVAAFNSVLIFFIDFYQFNGLSRTQAVSIYLYMNVTSTLFRFIPGLLKQIPHVSVLSIPVFSSLVGAIAMGIFPLVPPSYSSFLLIACLYGIGLGGMVTVLGISIIKLAGEENYSAALGISMTCSGIMNAAAGPISGFIRDTTGNYDMSFFCAAATLFMASVFFFITMVARFYTGSGSNKSSRLDFELFIRRKSRRRSSILPWRKQSVDISK
ncbi:SLC16A9 [Mytilus coruscus]|uniref:SLC16A9 n=1 Tax=Mytilus coruscus TaxID=42192 RepID=A0A6J8E2X0_MYTCO|nr:SLC16A9 [Mytilus coruscus]